MASDEDNQIFTDAEPSVDKEVLLNETVEQQAPPAQPETQNSETQTNESQGLLTRIKNCISSLFS